MCGCNQLILVLLTLFTSSAVVSAGSITYTIQNYPDQQNGWTLSGEITTDGTIGALSQKNIESWEWDISKKGVGTFEYSSKDKNSAILKFNGLVATEKQITLPQPPGTQEVNILRLTDSPPKAPAGITASLTWSLSGAMGRSSFYSANYITKNAAPNAWTTDTATLGGNSPWIIAATASPEPASIVMLGTGVLLALMYHCARARGRVRPASA
jgi:hypothetical protein